MTSYEKLKEMYDDNEFAFRMAIGQLLNWGTDESVKITDEKIENAHVQMIADWLYHKALKFIREMAKIENEDYGALIKFCIVEKIYDTKGFKPRRRK